MKLLRHLPNAMTCGNLLCGCLGILAVFEHDLMRASGLIFLAAALDFGDGFVARLVRAQSAIGKELDSLADCVTFGVLPAFIVYAFLVPDTEAIQRLRQVSGAASETYSTLLLPGGYSAAYLAFLLAIFSALRLAKFNVDTRQTDSFIGVPTPANALVVAAMPFIVAYNPAFAGLILHPLVQLGYVVVMSYLLTSELPLFALKFKTFGWSENRIKYIFLLFSALLLLFLQFAAVPLVIFLYIALSLFSK